MIMLNYSIDQKKITKYTEEKLKKSLLDLKPYIRYINYILNTDFVYNQVRKIKDVNNPSSMSQPVFCMINSLSKNSLNERGYGFVFMGEKYNLLELFSNNIGADVSEGVAEDLVIEAAGGGPVDPFADGLVLINSVAPELTSSLLDDF